MKSFLLFLFFASFTGNAQQLVLVDRNFQLPLKVTDTITVEQVSKGLMPIYFKDVYTVITSMERLVKYMNAGKMNKEDILDLKMGNSICVVQTEKTGRLNTYNIVLNTMTSKLKTHMVLAASEPNKRAVQRLNIFMDYLKNNSPVIAEKQ